MAAKSILQVDVQDEAWKEFVAAFDKYKDALAKMPGAWGKINAESKGLKTNFEIAASAAEEQSRAAEKSADAARDAEGLAGSTAHSWGSIAKSSGAFASNIGRATISLLKWTGIATAVTGLLGIGGLWGLDELGLGVASRRRSALGLGLRYGEQQAFETNFQRIVEPNSFLSGINDALTDPSQRYRLWGLGGLTQGQIEGKDAAQVGAELLVSMKRLADRTPTAMLASVLHASGKDQFFSVEDFQRLQNTPWSEIARLENQFPKDATKFGLSPDNQVAWQNFTTRLQEAGASIENIFVKGLAPLAKPLGDLSTSFEKAATTLFGQGSHLAELIPKLGSGIEHLAEYLASAKFQKDIQTFTTDIGQVGSAIAGMLPGFRDMEEFFKLVDEFWNPPALVAFDKGAGAFHNYITGDNGKSLVTGLPLPGNTSTAESKWHWPTLSGIGSAVSSALSGLPSPEDYGSSAPNSSNPGNIRGPGGKGYAWYPGGPDAGIWHMAGLLHRYQDKYHLNTMREMIARWAPPSDHNDDASYVRDVARRSGLPTDSRLDLSDEITLSKLVAAMSHHENPKTAVTTAQVLKALAARAHAPVRVVVQNDTGGSAIIQANMAAR